MKNRQPEPPKGARLLDVGENTRPGDYRYKNGKWTTTFDPPNPACGDPRTYARDVDEAANAIIRDME